MTRVPAPRPGDAAPTGRAGGALRVVAGWRRRLEATFAGRCVATFLDLQGIDRAMALAAQAFTALIPLLLMVSTLAGGGDVVPDALIRRFHLTGDGAHEVRVLFSGSGDGGTGALSAVLLVFSAVSLARRLQRMYLQAWRIESVQGFRGQLNAGLGLAALLVELGLLSVVRALVAELPGVGGLGWPMTFVAGFVLWTSIPWLLLDRRVAWRRLLPAGVLAAVCTSIYGLATTVYMPALMESYSRRYGIFGVTLALVGWLLAIALIVVAATVIAAEFDRASEPWAGRLRRALRLTASPSEPPSPPAQESAAPEERPAPAPRS